MTKEEKNLESQIGALGGDPSQFEQETMIGKKIKHVPGKKELSQNEEQEMEEFLQRSRKKSTIQQTLELDEQESPRIINVSEGWNEISRAELGQRSMFYPADWRFFIKPASVEAIKNWSAIDEERFDTVNAVLNEIIRSCVSIKTASGNVPWSRLNSWDRFWFVLKVREYTFRTGESEIKFDDHCSECDEKITYTLDCKSLYYEFPDEDIMRHWNETERAWYINPREYDVEHDTIKLYVPTLEKDQAILDWAVAQARAKKKIKDTFLKYLPWLLPKAPKDEKVLDKFIKDCELQYDSWDVDMFEFMEDVVNNIQISPSENLKKICPHCGEEVISHVQFPSGQVKYLFKSQTTKHKKFGSR